MIASFAQTLGNLRGWRRLAVAFAAGLAAILAFPPLSVVVALWIAFPILLWLLDGCRTWRAAAAVGWSFGFGHFITSFYWITEAFYVDPETAAFGIPAVGALCFGFAFYIAAVCAITHLLPPPTENDLADERLAAALPRVVLFAAAWTVLDWVRGWLFSGFPWNPIATVWSETATPIGLPMIQVTTLIGTYGLGLFTVAAAAAPSVLGGSLRNRRSWVAALLPVAVLLMIAGGGWLRLAYAETKFVPGVKLRLVQADFSEADRQRQSLFETQVRDYLTLSAANRPADTTAVIWGEAAVPLLAYVNVSEPFRRVLAAAAPPGGLLITGADRGIRTTSGEEQDFNSLYVLAPDGDIVASYDKTHLVPYGEYLPLRWLVPFKKLAAGRGDFTPGSGLTTLNVPGLPPFSPLICYEAIFSGAVTARDKPRPRWLLNLTNDAWFGSSAGPYQHFAAARLRAVEEGLPLVRVANTGISAVIDGYGRTLNQLGLGERGVLDVALPLPAATQTPFGSLRNLIPICLATFGGGLAFLARRRSRAAT